MTSPEQSPEQNTLNITFSIGDELHRESLAMEGGYEPDFWQTAQAAEMLYTDADITDEALLVERQKARDAVTEANYFAEQELLEQAS